MSRLSDTTFPNPFFLVVKMRCITSMDIKIFTIDVAGQCGMYPFSRIYNCIYQQIFKQWDKSVNLGETDRAWLPDMIREVYWLLELVMIWWEMMLIYRLYPGQEPAHGEEACLCNQDNLLNTI